MSEINKTKDQNRQFTLLQIDSLETNATTFIYTLSEPGDNGVVRYVGKSGDPGFRLEKGHKKEKGNSHKNHWLKSLLKQGLEPVLEILDEVPENEWRFWEMYYISLVKSWGFNLVNDPKLLGGEGWSKGHSPWNKGLTKETSEVVKRVGEKNKITLTGRKNKPRSQEVRKKLSLAKLGSLNPQFGKKQNTEHVKQRFEKIKETRIKNNNFTKEVLQLNPKTKEVIKIFKSLKEAGSTIERCPSGISMACKGVIETFGGFAWKYK